MEGKQQSLSPNNQIPSLSNMGRPAFSSHSRSVSQPSSFFPPDAACYTFSTPLSFPSKREQSGHLGVDVHMNDQETNNFSSNSGTGGGNLVPPFSLLPPLSPSMNSQLKRNGLDVKHSTVNNTDVKNRQHQISSASTRKGHRRAVSEIPFDIKTGSGLEALFGRSMNEESTEAIKLPSLFSQNDHGLKLKRQLIGDNGPEKHSSRSNLLSAYLGMEMDNGMEEDVSVSDSAEDSEKGDDSVTSTMKQLAPKAVVQHSRSASTESMASSGRPLDEALQGLADQPRKSRHSHSHSMDSSVSSRLESSLGEFDEYEVKKIMANDKLQELVMADPKKVKRILANRQSAARSKERKMRYITELERKVHTLQTEATTLSTQLTIMQRDSSGLLSENNELKLRLQGMEQQAHLHEALNEALQAEVHRLKTEASQVNEHGLHNQSPYPVFIQSQFNHEQDRGIKLSSLMLSSSQTGHALSCTSGSALPGLMTSS